jgi:hypothetical protein
LSDYAPSRRREEGREISNAQRMPQEDVLTKPEISPETLWEITDGVGKKAWCSHIFTSIDPERVIVATHSKERCTALRELQGRDVPAQAGRVRRDGQLRKDERIEKKEAEEISCSCNRHHYKPLH